MSLIDFEEARARIAGLEPHRPTTTVPLAIAAGRVLAEDVALDRDQPPFDRATMDGYAVHPPAGADGGFTSIGTVHAGSASDRAPQAGEAVRIMTGAPTPADCTVVPIEDCALAQAGSKETAGDQVRVTNDRHLDGRRNVAFRGEDGRAGDTILRTGTILGPAGVAAAAMAGRRELLVRQKPRVRILVSGDEVGGQGEAGIADSNGPFLLGFLGALGLGADHQHLSDDEAATAAALSANDVEVIITTGGVSMGDKDHIPAQARACGFAVIFHGVAIQPGKPALLARHADGRILLGLPGNPVSVIATAHLYLAAILRQVFGLTGPVWEQRPLSTPWQQRKKRLLFLPARIEDAASPGSPITPIPWNGSGDLLAAAYGDGLAMFTPQTDYDAGSAVPFLPYAGHIAGQGGRLPRLEG